ncbi:class I adenylate-forming enzyme family protein [Tomitella biformata]|uniref:class I adenylate-forming enzyme family protein n=1 Tax=Tomitella biformata TaxID=630403 RepID=UPI0004AD8394|nr:AMP-binding protein [Tomitella biformata]
MSSTWPWILSANTFDGLLEVRAQATPEATFLIDEHGVTMSYREYVDRVDRVAQALSERGVTRGSVVAWQLPTRSSTVLVMGALRRLGAVQASIITPYREREVTAALTTSAAEFFLIPGVWKGFDFGAMATGLRLEGPAPTIIEIGHDAPESAPGAAPLDTVAADPLEVAWIYFTSGSTGAPKGARHTDSSLLATGSGFAGLGRLGELPGEVAAMGFPVAHVGGIQYLIAALSGGFPILLLEAFVPDQAVRLFREWSVTTTGGAPPFYQALIAMARLQPGTPLVPTLRTLKGGGAPCPPSLFEQARDELGVVLAHDYGMTEVPMVAVADPADPGAILAATDGRVVPGNRVRIADIDGTECEPGTRGEVQVSGVGVCMGYTDPAETRRAFTADGWFHTGDLGVVHASGHIEVVGRLKDMIIRKGENIAPQELEQLLSAHPAIAEIAVIGLPDGERGELVCAVLVPAAGAETPTLGVLTSWLADQGLSRQKLPERLEVLAALPRTGLSKVAKAELRRQFAG